MELLTKQNEWKIREQVKANKAAELVKQHPELIANDGNALVAAAKNIRIELKAAFPGVKFSVSSKRFSMGDSIDVRWTDGPTTKQVDAIINKYSAGSFDGVTDCYNYSTDDAWTHAFGDAKYVHSNRSYSADLAAQSIKTLVKDYGSDGVPTVEEYQRGGARNRSPILNGNGIHDSWQTLINVECSRTDCLEVK